jgi:hypothetical protein
MSDLRRTEEPLIDPSLTISTMSNGLEPALTPQVMAFYATRAADTKTKIDQLGAEISQRQDKMRFINDLIADINTLTDSKKCLDLSKHPEIQEKLRVAKEMGININVDKVKFNSEERDGLIQNLHLKGKNWDDENKTQTQKMDIYIKELDRVMMLLKEFQKSESQSKRGALAGIKGG